MANGPNINMFIYMYTLLTCKQDLSKISIQILIDMQNMDIFSMVQ